MQHSMQRNSMWVVTIHSEISIEFRILAVSHMPLVLEKANFYLLCHWWRRQNHQQVHKLMFLLYHLHQIPWKVRSTLKWMMKTQNWEVMIEALAKEVKWAAANLPPDSAECRLITSLFLKVQGFVAKVCEVNFGCNKRCLKPSRCTGHHKQKSTLRSAARRHLLGCLSCCPIVKHNGACGMAQLCDYLHSKRWAKPALLWSIKT